MSDWFEDGKGAAHRVDLAAFMDSRVPDYLWACVAGGALVSVGTTSDGGAIGITITCDGRWRREYFRESEDAAAWLSGAVAAVQEHSQRLEHSTASSAGRGRSRRSGAVRGA